MYYYHYSLLVKITTSFICFSLEEGQHARGLSVHRAISKRSKKAPLPECQTDAGLKSLDLSSARVNKDQKSN